MSTVAPEREQSSSVQATDASVTPIQSPGQQESGKTPSPEQQSLSPDARESDSEGDVADDSESVSLRNE